MSHENVKKVLKDFGLTEKETEAYTYLAKHGALKSAEIVKGIRSAKGEVYRVLKSLQTKGLVESTLEFPSRYLAVPFETALDTFIKVKKEELTSVENARQELLDDWKSIGRTGIELPPEKFAVVEGNRRIYPKILQMIQETRSHFSTVSTVDDLLRADQFGLFDAIPNNPAKSKIKIRFLTELSRENLNAAKTLMKKTPKIGVNFKGRNPELGLQLSPRMVIRDEEEILFFITPKDASVPGRNDLCLWTNCKTLVQSFNAVFEELWCNSIEIEKKIAEIETGRLASKTYLISDLEAAKKRYDEALRSAREEIVMKTSAEGLFNLWKNLPQLKEGTGRGVSIRIMAPLASYSLQAVQELSNYCAVRHVPVGYLETTIVDGKHLFQFKNKPEDREKSKGKSSFENAFYTTDLEYIEKTKKMLDALWKNARSSPYAAPKSEISFERGGVNPLSGRPWLEDVDVAFTEERNRKITEKEVLDSIMNAKRFQANGPQRDVNVIYGSLAMAVIYPPDYFNLPEMRIAAWHIDKQSSLGAEDMVQVFLWLKTHLGYTYMPVASIGDNPEGVELRRSAQPMNATGQNHQLVKKDEIYVRIHGNALLAGWTVPIMLSPLTVSLPPACIEFESFGELKSGIFKTKTTYGRTQTWEFNGYEAFVTFFHPMSKYAGPGTDGLLYRDLIFTSRLTKALEKTKKPKAGQ